MSVKVRDLNKVTYENRRVAAARVREITWERIQPLIQAGRIGEAVVAMRAACRKANGIETSA